jgi:hypothetical protein
MNWIYNHKVRLALIVNGLYFISLFTPAQPHTRPRAFFGHPYGSRAESRRPPVYAPPPPPSGPSKAATQYSKETDVLEVYLSNDLTLIRKPGHTLLLSPTFNTKVRTHEQPATVLLRFVSFSQIQQYYDTTPLVITTDGEYMWDDTEPALYGAAHAHTGRHSVTVEDGGQVVETVGVSIPYDLFIEIISGRQVIVQLGDDSVELTAEQIETLRDMHRRLPQQSTAPKTADPVVVAPVIGTN